MQEENDILLRQVKAFAQGLGAILSKGKGGTSQEIIFPPKESQKLPYQEQLEQYIKTANYVLVPNTCSVKGLHWKKLNSLR
ncbi:hypothetical protein [Lactiplantibacillus plajomi]|uniref:Uncharacterized protein n=1 Tax=Lactiplantibacillus plajomi TaxID=1457217 RepID=A0ABV6K247_9LACO|nr:hypothetical protein [Lactiplantibacillus plajomi]